MDERIKVGTTVYLKPLLNAARRSKEPIECKIVKVARRYFDVQRDGDASPIAKFIIETMRQHAHGYSPDYELHFDLQEILDEYESNAIHGQMYRTVTDYSKQRKLTLDQLRRIKAILDEQEMK